MKYCHSTQFPVRLPGFLVLVAFLILGASGSAQVAHTDSSNRLFNIGIKAGLVHQQAFPTESPSQFYLTDGPVFDFKSYNIAVNTQLYRFNSFGLKLEFGFQQHTGAMAPDQQSRLWNGIAYGSFENQSVFLSPGFVYHIALGDRWALMSSAGAGFFYSLSPGVQLYSERFNYSTERSWVNLNAGLEVRTNLENALWLGFFIRGTYGWQSFTQLTYQDIENQNTHLLGSYRATGFDLGFSLSYCFTCR